MTLPAFAAAPVLTGAVVLAQQPGNGDNGGQGEDFGKSSPVGLLLLLLFLIAVVFLVRSMTKHLKRLPESFDDPGEQAAPADDERSAAEADASRPERDAGDVSSSASGSDESTAGRTPR
ncbi:hypothetical protein [Prauserella muralis]|uniref:Uncharacterized protein n=1 Tax=Prauserella muralis TaxID=588067 RepID=A0A2V4AMK2_9PSEU|nr:hypothetical protein [Prauserella muralis]PXY21214.1 hypothetical protein BAY60_27545 [Prauserella muralis]TWE30321.1 hypothetical protein FHX69_3018 [Prauserella muralis]